jgi:sulfur-oxidizing protein SoxX
MKHVLPLVAGALAVVLACPAVAADVAPGDVVFQEGAVETSLSGAPGDPAMGREVLGQRSQGNCVACHKISALSDVPWHGEVGPSLDGVADRWSEAELRGIVADAKKTFEGTIMPSFYKVDGFIRPGDAFTGDAAKELSPLLTAQQIEDAVAFLATLKE